MNTISTYTEPCHYCGGWHSGFCPKIESIEYYPDGAVKAVKFKGIEIDKSLPSIPWNWNKPFPLPLIVTD